MVREEDSNVNGHGYSNLNHYRDYKNFQSFLSSTNGKYLLRSELLFHSNTYSVVRE
jgi:hypothetical protein